MAKVEVVKAMTAPSTGLSEGAGGEARRRVWPVAGGRSAASPEVPAEGPPPAPRKAPRAQGWILRRLLIEEATIMAVVWCVALITALLPHWPDPDARTAAGVIASVAVLTVSGLLMAAVLQLYRSRVSALRSITVERQALLAATSTVIAVACLRLLAPEASSAPVVVGGVVLLICLAVGRAGFDSWLTVLRRTGAIGRQVVLIGQTEETEALAHLLASHPEIGYRPVGVVADQAVPVSAGDGEEDLPWLGPLDQAATAMRDHGANGAIIAANGLGSVQLNALVRQLHRENVHVHLSSGLERIGHRRVRQLPMAHEPFFYLEPAAPGRGALAVKRMIDLVGALAILILTAPIMLVAAILVKLSDGGPVLFYQHRVGLGGEPVMIRKFRSMTVRAEEQLGAVQARNERRGPLFKVADDPRITRVGRWLRVTSIDELPQLINVLEGSLSLVGPRPALPSEVAQFDQELLGRLSMRPGVSGLWQVEARHNPSFYAYRHLDLFYVENWSLSLDVAVLAATVHTVLRDSADAVAKATRNRLTRRREQTQAAATAAPPTLSQPITPAAETAGTGS